MKEEVREWAMTYGFIPLVILFVGAALYSLGAFDPDTDGFSDYITTNNFVKLQSVHWCNRLEMEQWNFEDGLRTVQPLEVDCWTDRVNYCGFVLQGTLYYAEITDYGSVVWNQTVNESLEVFG